MLIENIVDDVAWVGKVFHMVGTDAEPPLSDKAVEGLRLGFVDTVGSARIIAQASG